MSTRGWPAADFLARIGSEIGVSDWHLIDQRRIEEFAVVTDDDQFIHTVPERARTTAFCGTIAHGYLTLSLLSAMARSALPIIEGTKFSLNYGFDKIRFLAHVPSGARIRARLRCRTCPSATQASGAWLLAS